MSITTLTASLYPCVRVSTTRIPDEPTPGCHTNTSATHCRQPRHPHNHAIPTTSNVELTKSLKQIPPATKHSHHQSIPCPDPCVRVQFLLFHHYNPIILSVSTGRHGRPKDHPQPPAQKEEEAKGKRTNTHPIPKPSLARSPPRRPSKEESPSTSTRASVPRNVLSRPSPTPPPVAPPKVSVSAMIETLIPAAELLRRRGKWVLLFLAGAGLSGYGLHRRYHSPEVERRRRKLYSTLKTLVSIAGSVSCVSEALTSGIVRGVGSGSAESPSSSSSELLDKLFFPPLRGPSTAQASTTVGP